MLLIILALSQFDMSRSSENLTDHMIVISYDLEIETFENLRCSDSFILETQDVKLTKLSEIEANFSTTNTNRA